MSDHATVSLETVFDTIGLGIVASYRRIVLANRAFHKALNLSPGAFAPGILFKEALRASARAMSLVPATLRPGPTP